MSQISNAPLLTPVIQSDFQLKIILILSAIPGLALFLGIYPSLASFTSLSLYILLARRFFPYYYGADEVLVSVLFVLGLIYLIKIPSDKNQISFNENPFVLLLLVQLTLIYWFNGLNKTHISWWNGEAVGMTLFNVLFNKPLGIYFMKFENLNKFLTYSTLLFEITFPVWIFSGYKPKKLRIIGALLILFFHWGISIFVDVTLYKYFGLAFFFLLMPDSFWNRYRCMEKLVFKEFNYRTYRNKYLNIRVLQKVAVLLIVLISFKAVVYSIHRQGDWYKLIKSENLKNVLKTINSKNLSPFKQGWTMFAPSPPQDCGYFAFEYSDGILTDNISLYGDKVPFKNFPYYHPFHMAMVLQYAKVAKGYVNNESEFVLFNLFEYEVAKDLVLHPERKQENYELILYQQKYENFKRDKSYHFDRIVLAAYE